MAGGVVTVSGRERRGGGGGGGGVLQDRGEDHPARRAVPHMVHRGHHRHGRREAPRLPQRRQLICLPGKDRQKKRGFKI